LNTWAPDIIVIEDPDSTRIAFDFIYKIRNDENIRHVGIVTLSSLSDSKYEEHLFQCGADAVLDHDIKLSALVLRLNALIQRIDGFQGLQETKISVGEILIHPRAKSVELNGKRMELTPTQYSLLLAFACQPNQVLTRQWLKQNIWKGRRVSPRSIDAQISKLKRILPPLHDRIINIYGEGYLLVPHKKAA
jgi:DNA-binding response OmpR family regulator